MAAIRIAAAACLALGAAGAAAQPVDNPFDYTRTSSFTYRADGLLETETVEPDLPDLCVKTTHTYDDWGNKKSALVAPCAGASAGAQFAARASSSIFEGAAGVTIGDTAVTPPDGTFVVRSSNAKNHTEVRSHDPRFGTLLSLTGPNALATRQTLDHFGRVIRELRADGTSTAFAHCIISGRGLDDTSNDTDACGTSTAALSGLGQEIPPTAITYVQTVAEDTAGNAMGPRVRVYKDRAGRTVREIAEVALNDATQPADRRWVVKDVEYSATGVAVVKTQPYFLGPGSSNVTGSNDYGLEVTTVDALGRPVQVDVADPQGNAGQATLHGRTRVWARTTVSYLALKTTTTNPKGQKREEEKNVEGGVTRITDAYGGQLAHQHDAFGNLVQTKDALQNLVKLSYDVRGRKLSLTDPDTGEWTYDYNALGELVWQQSPNQRIAGTATTMAYDQLGRMTQRVEPEYTSLWHYDAYANGSACNKGLGKLCESVTSHGVTKKHVFDSLGRPSSSRTTVANGPSFASSLSYASTTGRPYLQTYPTGLRTQFVFTSLGALHRVRLKTATTIVPLPASPGGTPGATVTLPADTVLWQAGSVNAWGRAATQSLGGASLGNGTVVRTNFDPFTGRVTAANAGPGSSKTVLDYSYAWDSLNNLATRTDAIGDGNTGAVNENFAYDNLNRLTSYSVAAPAVPQLQRTVTLSYNAIGNLLYKSDVGNYSYPAYGNNAGVTRLRPHGVTQVSGTSFGTVAYGYDANGNVVTADGGKWRSIAYTSFNLPDSNQGAAGPGGTPRYTWQYDESHQRIRETRVTSAGTRTTWYQHPDNQGGLAFESETAPGGGNSHRHYVSAGSQTIVLVTTGALPTLTATQTAPAALASATLVKLEFWLKDHLGSVVATADHTGAVTARFAYDPFGKRRETNGQYDAFGTLVIDWANNVNHGIDRGFTGHEHLDELGLVHMNGRVFDPTIARFLQGDPFVQAPDELQNYNRYGYCYNNPLNCTDPSGYFSFKKLFRAVAAIAIAVYMPALIESAMIGSAAGGTTAFATMTGGTFLSNTAALTGLGQFTSVAVSGFLSGAVAGGSFKAGLQGAFSAGLFFGVGEMVGSAGLGAAGAVDDWSSFAGAIALHGVAGCVTAVAGGSKCGPGALSAAFSKAALPATAAMGIKDGLGRAMAHAVVGGTASKLGGGQFANGAMHAAFSYLFNHCEHDPDSCGMGSPEGNRQGLSNTAGDTAGLYALAGMVGVPAIVGGTYLALGAGLSTTYGSAVFYDGYFAGAFSAAAAYGTRITDTMLGRFVNYVQYELEIIKSTAPVWGRVWRGLSSVFANAAQGPVRVLPWSSNPSTVLKTVELPILRQNGNPITTIPKP